MAVKYLLDTNILSEPVRSQPNPHVIRQMEAYSGNLAISSITWHELLFGLFKLPSSQRRTTLEDYMFNTIRNKIPILSYDADSAAWFALQRARLSQMGRSPSFPDGQIAAVAATNKLILVTRNISDFLDFEDVQLENWFEKKE